MKSSPSIRLLLILIVVFISLDVFLAIHYYGFLTGDEVELIESALKITLHTDYQPWNIRNLFIPYLIFAPILQVARLIGTQNPMIFVYITRIIVISFSSLNIYLIFLICQRLTHDHISPVLAAYFYAFSFLTLSFSSSGFARPISTTLILAALLILIKSEIDAKRCFFSGLLMAAAFASRYSEVCFIIPLLVFLITEKPGRYFFIKRCSLFLTGFLLGCMIFVGLFENLVSGVVAGNLRAMIRYTIIDGKCSSAEVSQPGFYYFLHIFNWIPATIVPFIVMASFRRRMFRIWLFIVIPVLLLSALAHKELRYLQGVIPFVSMIAAVGASEILKTKFKLIGFAMIIFFGTTGVRDTLKILRNKTMPAVRAAQEISRHGDIKHVALSQAWAYGNGIIMCRTDTIIDLLKPFCFSEFQQKADDIDALGVYRSDYLAQKKNMERILEEGFEILKEFDGQPKRAIVVFVRRGNLNSVIPE